VLNVARESVAEAVCERQVQGSSWKKSSEYRRRRAKRSKRTKGCGSKRKGIPHPGCFAQRVRKILEIQWM
jgi:hypothetical protein